MKCLRFALSGSFACFRRPDVNAEVYFTYNNIHRVALLGILGAVLGLNGYPRIMSDKAAKKTHTLENDFPEFYEVLSPLLISVAPVSKSGNGYFTKKIQYFNNSVGYASKELGGNLQVKEQWLENPEWTVLLMRGGVINSVWERLCDSLINERCVYMPYLGRNDFPARINAVEYVELLPSTARHVDSLFLCDGELKALTDGAGYKDYLFAETAPVALAQSYNFYLFGKYVLTNSKIRAEMLPKQLFTDGVKNYAFN